MKKNKKQHTRTCTHNDTFIASKTKRTRCNHYCNIKFQSHMLIHGKKQLDIQWPNSTSIVGTINICGEPKLCFWVCIVDIPIYFLKMVFDFLVVYIYIFFILFFLLFFIIFFWIKIRKKCDCILVIFFLSSFICALLCVSCVNFNCQKIFSFVIVLFERKSIAMCIAPQHFSRYIPTLFH